MAWAYVIRSSDRAMFKRCRRAWDLGSRSQQNYEPVQPARAFDFDQAIHDALALYYFPGMWAWNREIVIPMVLDGFFKSMERQRTACLETRALSDKEEKAWNSELELGQGMLEHYFVWAPTIDRFEPIRVASDFEVNIPDPCRPGHDLAAPRTTPHLPIRYRGRCDVLALDGYDAYWIIDHRIAGETWAELDQLLLDERGVAACWALQNFDPGMKIAGVIYNEIRKAVPNEPCAATIPARSVLTTPGVMQKLLPRLAPRGLYRSAVREPEHRVEQRGNAFFRRTAIARSQKELENAGRQIALEALDIAHPDSLLYANPVWEACSVCAYRRPCMAMNEGANAEAILSSFYRKRTDDEFEPGRLGGSTWSIDRGSVPPNLGRKG
jgi:hypothetical protein